jgi:pyrimidine operon attenuation protein/uracil phosphoribosyltransferase
MGAVGLIEKRVLLDASGVAQVLDRLATEVAGLVANGPSAVIGIQTGGVHVARRILDRLAARGTPLPPVGTLDITLYRDDIGMTREQPQVRRTDIPFELSRTGVVLVDDVLFTGRTVRAALDALVDFGRPRFIRLAVLVDRGFREYPIQADCTGLRADTEPAERVQVELVEMGAPADRVVVYERE